MKKIIGLFVIAIGFGFFLGIVPALADHLGDARKYRSEGKNIEAALSATKGCGERNGAESCAFLCALGIETSTQAWIDAGCGSACNKGFATSCTTLGSRKVMSGQTTEGLRLLRMGCTLGDKLGCSQIKLLGK